VIIFQYLTAGVISRFDYEDVYRDLRKRRQRLIYENTGRRQSSAERRLKEDGRREAPLGGGSRMPVKGFPLKAISAFSAFRSGRRLPSRKVLSYEARWARAFPRRISGSLGVIGNQPPSRRGRPKQSSLRPSSHTRQGGGGINRFLRGDAWEARWMFCRKTGVLSPSFRVTAGTKIERTRFGARA
jgi:hypothetical protein